MFLYLFKGEKFFPPSEPSDVQEEMSTAAEAEETLSASESLTTMEEIDPEPDNSGTLLDQN